MVLVGDFPQELELFRSLMGHKNQFKVESVELNVKLLKNYFAIHTSLKETRFFTVHGMLVFYYSSEEVFWAETYEQEQNSSSFFCWLPVVL